MGFVEITVIKQLKDAAKHVSQRKCKNSLAQMFSIELYLIKHTLMGWFNRKIKSQHLQIDILIKNTYEKKNLINSVEDRCCLCKFPLKVDSTNHSTPNNQMIYRDFCIRYEHKFLRNIYTEDQIQTSPQISTLENYYKTFQKFLRICLSLQSILISHNDVNDIEDFHYETRDFIRNDCLDYSVEELRKHIEEIEIKNLVSAKIPKFNLQLYAFVYDNLIQFPVSDLAFDTITTNNFFRYVHRLLKVKVHLHHSHVTGEIYGYIHDFWNWQVTENETEISILVHNFFGFDAFYFLKGFQATTWGTKDVSIEGSNLTHINYANINGGELKCIDTLKYYQKSLGQLADTLSDKEREAAKKVSEHDYFSEVWKYLGPTQKEKILDTIAAGKGLIPYEKITNQHSFFVTPKNGAFFEKTEFFSELKNKGISDSAYESSFYLYSILKMRNLGDMNDLYNAQDTILLCEIIENTFQLMQDEYGYNPRKCNSASILSGCIEREMCK